MQLFYLSDRQKCQTTKEEEEGGTDGLTCEITLGSTRGLDIWSKKIFLFISSIDILGGKNMQLVRDRQTDRQAAKTTDVRLVARLSQSLND